MRAMAFPSGLGASPVYQLAAQHLRHPDIQLYPALPTAQLHRAVATNNNGLDHLACEEFVALATGALDRDGDYAAVLSDRRLFRAVAQLSLSLGFDEYDLPIAAVTGAQPEASMLASKLRLLSGPQSVSVPVPAGALAPLAAFFDALARVPPDVRSAPPHAPVAPTADDPTGAAALAQAMGPTMLDPRVHAMLRVIHEANRRGELPAAAGADLATRAWVLGRTVRLGRGMRAGFWQSAVGLADLLRVFVGFFGAPTRSAPNGRDTVFDFVRAGGRNTGAAIASSAAGLAMLAVVGVGWVSVPREQIQGFRVVMRDLGGATGFMLLTGIGGRTIPLARHQRGRMFESILADLVNLEALLLLGRCAFGWNPTPDQLLAMPRGALEARVQSLAGPVDLSLFFALIGGRR